jgi:formimidoylglutamate deiminase
MTTLYRPDLLYADGRFQSGSGLLIDNDGRILDPDAETDSGNIVYLPGKAILPGFVNTHSHSFQRLIRGKSESRVTSGKDFWSWRGTMYHAAAHLSPDEVYNVARMAFLEMVLAGTTTVGEFHYLHAAPIGSPYEDPNLLAKKVIAAARSIGIRIALLRSAYLRSGYQLPPDPGQRRFYETLPAFLGNMAALANEIPATPAVSLGVAPHSIRAVPLDSLREIASLARDRHLPLHMHISEQVAENEACLREYGSTPIALLAKERLLGPDWTAIHATHTTAEEIAQLADANATICACPTTERNLGDGILAAGHVMRSGISVALGSDSQAQIDPLEDARELDYHLRLAQQQRAILDQIGNVPLARRLYNCATTNADFFTIDLHDPSIAGHSADDLLPLIVFGLDRTAVRDVCVNGRLILRDGLHPLQDEIVSRYAEVHDKVWRNTAGRPQ